MMQLPFQNMMVVGAEFGPRSSNNYMLSENNNNFFDREAYDARRILQTETSQPIIRDLNIRLLNTKTTARNIAIRNIKVLP